MTLLVNALETQITAVEERLEAAMNWPNPGVFFDDPLAFEVNFVSGFQLAIGSGTAGDRAVVPAISRLGGVYPILHDSGTDSLTLGSPHASLDRIDLVGVQVRDNPIDASGFSDVTFSYVEGVADAVPVAPAAPAGFLVLAEVLRDGGEVNVTPGNIADVRTSVIPVNPHGHATTSATTVIADNTAVYLPLTDQTLTGEEGAVATAGSGFTLNKPGLWMLVALVKWSASTGDGYQEVELTAGYPWAEGLAGPMPTVKSYNSDLDGGHVKQQVVFIGRVAEGEFQYVRVRVRQEQTGAASRDVISENAAAPSLTATWIGP